MDLSSDVDIVAMSRLNLELSEREDEILLKASKNTPYKILKIILFKLGLLQGKMQYEMEQKEKKMDSFYSQQKAEVKDLLDNLKSWKD